MYNTALDVLTQGGKVVNQASANTTQTLGLMERNTEAQAQARQDYVRQTNQAIQAYQTAQLKQEELMIKSTFDVQNQYLNTLVNSNNNFMNQRHNAMSLDLQVQQLKETKKYHDAVIDVDKARIAADMQIAKMNNLVKIEAAKIKSYSSNIGNGSQTYSKNVKNVMVSPETIESFKNQPEMMKMYKQIKLNAISGNYDANSAFIAKNIFGIGSGKINMSPTNIFKFMQLNKQLQHSGFTDLISTMQQSNDPDISKLGSTLEQTFKKIKTDNNDVNITNPVVVSMTNQVLNDLQLGKTKSLSDLKSILISQSIPNKKINQYIISSILPQVQVKNAEAMSKLDDIIIPVVNNINKDDKKTTSLQLRSLSAFYKKNADVINNDKQLTDAIANKISSLSSYFNEYNKNKNETTEALTVAMGTDLQFFNSFVSSIEDVASSLFSGKRTLSNTEKAQMIIDHNGGAKQTMNKIALYTMSKATELKKDPIKALNNVGAEMKAFRKGDQGFLTDNLNNKYIITKITHDYNPVVRNTLNSAPMKLYFEVQKMKAQGLDDNTIKNRVKVLATNIYNSIENKIFTDNLMNLLSFNTKETQQEFKKQTINALVHDANIKPTEKQLSAYASYYGLGMVLNKQ